ncbi:MAG TPA: peptidoglycan editing factor PgeF [Desulfotignum sp.]|nr:peptidoglycan editing factor PgeF [Desulfotignum sp.]
MKDFIERAAVSSQTPPGKTGPGFRRFSHLSGCPDLAHAVFDRTGGVSTPPFDSLNVGFSTGDDPDAVMENRSRILSFLGLSRALFVNQVHGSDMLVLPAAKADPHLFWKPGLPAPATCITADGMVTDLPDLALVIQVADCQAVLLADPVKKVVANVHSGWRGSLENIIGKCVDVMTGRFTCRPEDILAGISPSLGPCCAEFKHFRTEIPQHLWQYKHPHKDYFDFWALSRDQLLEKNLHPDHVKNMCLCTQCRPDRFFSFRNAGRTGRFACAIGIC